MRDYCNQPVFTYPVCIGLGTLPYYGQAYANPGVQKTREFAGTEWQLKIALGAVVGEGRPTVLGVTVIDKDRTHDEVVQRLLRKVTPEVEIDTVYVNRGLATVEGFSPLADADLRYLGRTRITSRVEPYRDELDHDVKVVHDHCLSHWRGSEVVTSLVLLRLADAPTDEPVAFVTNADVDDTTAQARQRTREFITQTDYRMELETIGTKYRQQEVLQAIAGIGDWFAGLEGDHQV